MEPVSRASAWRRGYPNPADYNDNQGYCGGYSLQWMQYGGKCGVCGDPYGASPRNHEAPGGRYANGIIVREYRAGQVIDVQVDLTANHKGSFTFKMCANNNINRDSGQHCFDRHNLKVYPEMTDNYTLPSAVPGSFYVKLKLPDGLTCSQCVLQWTYYTANSWGGCGDGTQGVGCGAQETFRACSDIKISTNGPKNPPRETDFFTNNIPNSGFSPQSTQSVFFHNPKTTKLERPQFSFSWNSALGGDSSTDDSPKKKRRKKKKNRRKKKKRIKDRPRFDDGSKRRRKKKKNKNHGGRSREEVDPTLPGMDHNIPPDARARFSAVANSDAGDSHTDAAARHAEAVAALLALQQQMAGEHEEENERRRLEERKRKEQRNRKEQRRKIKERMERKRQQERRRQERRREEEERQRLQQFQESKTTEILPPPNNNPADPKQPYGYFTFSLGDEETRFGFLGSPGNEQAIEDDKLKEFKDVMKGILP